MEDNNETIKNSLIFRKLSSDENSQNLKRIYNSYEYSKSDTNEKKKIYNKTSYNDFDLIEKNNHGNNELSIHILNIEKNNTFKEKTDSSKKKNLSYYKISKKNFLIKSNLIKITK